MALDSASVVQRATSIVSHLSGSRYWTASTQSATISAPAILLIRSIDPPAIRPGAVQLADYFIVPITREVGITARLAIDADTGRFLEAEGVLRDGAALPPFVNPIDALARSNVTMPVKVANEAVWRPCRESVSRFVPFWQVQDGQRVLYVRVDGRVFESLTTTGRG